MDIREQETVNRMQFEQSDWTAKASEYARSKGLNTVRVLIAVHPNGMREYVIVEQPRR